MHYFKPIYRQNYFLKRRTLWASLILLLTLNTLSDNTCFGQDGNRQNDINLAQEYIDQNDLSKAREIIEDALGETADADETGMSGSPGSQQATLLLELAQVETAEDNFKAANQCLERCLQLRTKIFGRIHPLRAQALTQAALTAQKENDIAKAEANYQDAINIWDQLDWPISKDADKTAQCYENFLMSTQRVSEAKNLRQRLDKIDRKSAHAILTKVDDDGSLWSTYILAGQKSYAEKKKSNAEKLFRQALKEATNTNNDWQTINSYIALIALLESDNRIDEALQICNQALDSNLTILNSKDPSLINFYNQLAVIYLKANLLDQAKEAVQKSIDIADNSKQTFSVRANKLLLLSILLKSNDENAAEVTFQDLLKESKQLNEQDKNQLLSDLADCLHNAGRVELAKQMYKDLSKTEQSKDYADYLNAAKSLENQGKIALLEKKDDQSKIYFSKAVECAKKSPYEDSVQARLTLVSSYLELCKLLVKANDIESLNKDLPHLIKIVKHKAKDADSNYQSKQIEALRFCASTLANYGNYKIAYELYALNLELEKSAINNPDNWLGTEGQKKKEEALNVLRADKEETASAAIGIEKYQEAFQLLQELLKDDKTIEDLSKSSEDAPIKRLSITSNWTVDPNKSIDKNKIKAYILYALCLQNLNQCNKAEALYGIACKEIKECSSRNNILLACLYENYALLLKQTDRSARANYVLKAAQDLRELTKADSLTSEKSPENTETLKANESAIVKELNKI